MFEEASFRIRDLSPRQLLLGLGKAVIPLFVAGTYLAYIYTLGETGRILLPLLVAYFVPPFGKESVIPLGVSLGVHPALMAFSVAMVDVLVGLFLLWNYKVLYYVPILGKWAHKMEVKAKRMIDEGRGFSKLAYLGLILFVIVPFQGSGAVSATILGKMSGMDARKVWSAIILGAFAGTFMVAYSFNLVLAAFRSNLLLGVGLVLAVVAVAVFFYLRWKRETGKSITLHDIREVSLMAVTTGVDVESPPDEP
ncbi:MAG: small multi-drug export protein [Thermoplasmata archaeon]